MREKIKQILADIFKICRKKIKIAQSELLSAKRLKITASYPRHKFQNSDKVYENKKQSPALQLKIVSILKSTIISHFSGIQKQNPNRII